MSGLIFHAVGFLIVWGNLAMLGVESPLLWAVALHGWATAVDAHLRLDRAEQRGEGKGG